MPQTDRISTGFFSRFVKDQRGNTAILVALGLMSLMAAAGVAVDGVRALHVRTKLSHAADAAALAGAKVLKEGVFDADARRFFAANFPAETGLTPSVTSVTPNVAAGTLEVKAQAVLQTSVMKLFNKNSITVTTTATAGRQMTAGAGMEIVLVLDTTGSMGDKASGCQGNNCPTKLTGLKTAANQLMDVIYGGTVAQGGKATVDKVWVSVVPFSSRVNIKPHKEWLTSVPVLWQYLWAGCADMRSGGNKTTDAPPSVQLFPDWKPGGSTLNAWDQCPPARVLPLTAEQMTVRATFESLEAKGNTRTDIGMAWGWRAISPLWKGLWGGSDNANMPRAYRETNMKKIAILMTDGINTPTSSNGDTETIEQTNNQLLSTCSGMKQQGVEIYTISFDAPSSLHTTFQSCATSPDKHFVNAMSNEELQAAFGRIGEDLVNKHLRLIH